MMAASEWDSLNARMSPEQRRDRAEARAEAARMSVDVARLQAQTAVERQEIEENVRILNAAGAEIDDRQDAIAAERMSRTVSVTSYPSIQTGDVVSVDGVDLRVTAFATDFNEGITRVSAAMSEMGVAAAAAAVAASEGLSRAIETAFVVPAVSANPDARPETLFSFGSLRHQLDDALLDCRVCGVAVRDRSLLLAGAGICPGPTRLDILFGASVLRPQAEVRLGFDWGDAGELGLGPIPDYEPARAEWFQRAQARLAELVIAPVEPYVPIREPDGHDENGVPFYRGSTVEVIPPLMLHPDAIRLAMEPLDVEDPDESDRVVERDTLCYGLRGDVAPRPGATGQPHVWHESEPYDWCEACFALTEHVSVTAPAAAPPLPDPDPAVDDGPPLGRRLSEIIGESYVRGDGALVVNLGHAAGCRCGRGGDSGTCRGAGTR